MFTVEFKRTHSSDYAERLGLTPDRHMAIVYKPEFREDGTSWQKVQYVVEAKTKATVARYAQKFIAQA
jgi:hypothetical protein